MHHKMVPLFIALIGLNFILVNMGIYDEMMSAYIWPVLLTLIGLMKLMGGGCKCCAK
jgi:hypothetical protein